jgi:acetyltransferase-like isoleucine patch superfamily enzyme
MSEANLVSFEDPVRVFLRAVNKLHSLWLSWSYPFASVGPGFSAHYSCDISRTIAGYIKIGNKVWIGRNARVHVPIVPDHNEAVILLDDGCVIGSSSHISAINRIHVERNVIFGPSVLLMDHNHEFADVTLPIAEQGTTKGGTIRIGEGSWLGNGSAIVSNEGELVIGRNSVVGVNSVVTRSIPPYSVVMGNPARIVKQFDVARGEWVVGSSGSAGKS